MLQTRTLDDALTVEPGATCLDRATLLADLRSWRDPQAAQEPFDPRISMRVLGSSEDPNQLTFVVWVDDEVAAERRFDQTFQSCADLHAVVSLALAIALDDTLASALGIIDEPVPPPAPSPPPTPVQPLQVGDDDLPLLERRPRPSTTRRGPALGLTVAAAAFAGLTPGLSGGGELFFDIRPLDHFDLRLGALTTHHPNFVLDQGRVGITVAAGRLDLCWGSKPRTVRVRACAGAAGGATVSAGRGFSTNFRRSIPWLAGIAATDVTLQIVGPLALELRLEGVFPFQRTNIDVRSEGGELLATERFPVAGVVVAVGPRFEF